MSEQNTPTLSDDYFHVFFVTEMHEKEPLSKLAKYFVGTHSPTELLGGMTFQAKWGFHDLDSARAFAQQRNDEINELIQSSIRPYAR